MATTGTMVVNLKANTAQFDKRMKNSRKRVSGFTKTIRSFGAAVGLYFGGRAIGRFTVGAVRAFADFEKQLALVNTMLKKGSSVYMPAYRKQLKKLSVEYGQTLQTLTKGLYDILSAGVGAGDAIGLLEVASRAAIAGATDTATAVDGLTTVLNAYQLSAKKAAYVSDIMFAIVRDGKITYEELAANIGKLAPVAKAAGMSLEDMAAAVATLVKVEKPERAFVALRTAMMTATQQGKTLFEMVRMLRGATLRQIMDAGFQKRSASAVAILTNNYVELIDEINRMNQVTGEAGEAFDKMADNASMKIDRLKAAWNDFLVSIGSGLVDFSDAIGEVGREPKVKPRSIFDTSPGYITDLKEQQKIWKEWQEGRIDFGKIQADKVLAEAERIAKLSIALGDKSAETVSKVTTRLKEQIATYGMLSGEVQLYKLAKEGAYRADIWHAEVLVKQLAALERTKQATEIYTDMVADLRRGITVLAGTASEQEWELFDLQQLGATAAQIEHIRSLMVELNEVQEKMVQADKLKMQADKLKAFAEQVTESLKTPVELFKEYRTRLQELVEANLLSAAQMEKALGMRMNELMGGVGSRQQGEYRELRTALMDPKGLQIGGIDPVVDAQQKTNRLLEQIRDGGGMN